MNQKLVISLVNGKKLIQYWDGTKWNQAQEGAPSGVADLSGIPISVRAAADALGAGEYVLNNAGQWVAPQIASVINPATGTPTGNPAVPQYSNGVAPTAQQYQTAGISPTAQWTPTGPGNIAPGVVDMSLVPGQPNYVGDPNANTNMNLVNTDYLLAQEDMALRKYIAEGGWAVDKSIAAEQSATQRYIADQNAALQRELSAAEIAHQERMQQLDAQLQNQLLDKRITADEYMQSRDLAQRESEFARDIQLRTTIADRQWAIDQANLKMQSLEQQRLLLGQLASMAADPARTVEYEYFVRGLDNPEALGMNPEAFNLAQQFQGLGDLNQQLAGMAGIAAQPQTLRELVSGMSGGQFLPPAHTDEAMQQLVAMGLGANAQPGGQPGLLTGGTGAFGAEVPGTAEISRNQFLNASPTSLGILTSFLRGGIVNPATGAKVAINPDDFFAELAKGFVPGLDEAGSVTQYA